MRPPFLAQIALAFVALLAPHAPPDSPALREEFFVLELPTPSEGRVNRPPVPLAVGVAALSTRVDQDGEQAEWHLQFFEEGTHVQHVERWREGSAHMNWREWRPGAGRTLSVEANRRNGRVLLLEWGREESLRTTLDAPADMLLPLCFLERARRGEVGPGNVTCFDPLARSAEDLSVETAEDEVSNGDASTLVERKVTLRRSDGSQACAYRFRGQDLVGVEWQAGGLLARRIERADYDERRASAQPAQAGELSSR